MSFTREAHMHGFESYRDGSYKEKSREGTTIATRMVQYVHEILAIDPLSNLRDRGNGTIECRTGDLLGPVFIKSATPGSEDPEKRPIGSWWHGAPVIVTEATEGPPPGESGVPASVKVLPIFDTAYEADERYEPIEVSPFPGSPLPEIGSIGILKSATKEDGEAELLFLPSSLNRLIAPNLRGAKYDRGTYVYDLEGEDGDEPSEDFKAQLQTTWRVMRPVFGKDGTTETVWGTPSDELGDSKRIAFQLGYAQASKPIACMGLMVDQDSGGGSTIGGVTPLIAAFFGEKAGGPLFAGESVAEKHKIEPAGTGSETRDGATQCAGHLATCTFFKTPGGGKFFDAPLAFRPEISPKIPDLTFPAPVKLVYRTDAKHLFRGREEDHVWDWISFYDFGGSHDDPVGDPFGGVDPGGGTGAGSEDPAPGGGAVEEPIDPPDKPEEPRIPPDPPEIFCAGLKGLARPKKETPRLKKFTHNEDPHHMYRSYRYTPYHMAFSGLLAKGNPSIISEYGKDFSDYTRKPTQKDIDAFRDSSPISGQLISYAGYAETPFEAAYTKRPYDVEGKYLAGSASGGFMLLPAELDIGGLREVIDGDVTHPPEYAAGTLSEVRLVFVPESRLSFGYPALDTGKLHDGWNLRKEYNATSLKLTRESGGTETEAGSFQDTFSHEFGEENRIGATYSAAYGKQAWTRIKGERAFGVGSSGDEGHHQNSEYILLGELASGTASASLDIDGDAFAFPSGDSAYFFMAKTVIRSSSASALNADAVFVSRDEFAVNVTGGVASIIGAVTNHFSRDEFTSGGASISIGFSIASGNILRATVSKTGTDDVEVTCYLSATQCRNS